MADWPSLSTVCAVRKEHHKLTLYPIVFFPISGRAEKVADQLNRWLSNGATHPSDEGGAGEPGTLSAPIRYQGRHRKIGVVARPTRIHNARPYSMGPYTDPPAWWRGAWVVYGGLTVGLCCDVRYAPVPHSPRVRWAQHCVGP